jgi:Acyl-CoA dehydrogenase, N-terminal domain
MDYFFTEDQKSIQDLARRIAEERVVPVRAEMDEKEEFPWAPVEISGRGRFNFHKNPVVSVCDSG